jgi:AcrR family transcriptional regulator
MQTPRKPVISARKKPSQARSTQLVADILEAAIRVLVRDGGDRFSTIRVAEEAGVSVGSLYQYFPNKEALLFRLQADEWADTWSILEEILADPRTEPFSRLRRAVLTFFRSEREEAALRTALDETGILVDDSPEARAHVALATRSLHGFVAEVLPGVPEEARRFAGELLMRTMGAVAERITREKRSRAEVDAWANASAEMYCAYLERLAATSAAPPTRDSQSIQAVKSGKPSRGGAAALREAKKEEASTTAAYAGTPGRPSRGRAKGS